MKAPIDAVLRVQHKISGEWLKKLLRDIFPSVFKLFLDTREGGILHLA
jgi:hypothetical protein